ncbi:MAG TPA: DUF6352 family protein [Hyphomicrobiales bacterium]|jgi:hypothetical protein
MSDFWLSSGHILLERGEHGGLVLTDEFLKAYLARPELLPPESACAAERGIHAALLDNPRMAIEPDAVAAIADADARENWTVMLDFRDRLLDAPTLEAAYIRLIRQGVKRLPPLFVNQLAHVIMRNALEGCTDAFVARAGEIFYRTQRVAVQNGAIMLADAETVERYEADFHASPLTAMFADGIANLEVLKPENADGYWSRSDAFDLAFELGGVDGGRRAVATALERWVRQLFGLEVEIEPLERIDDGDVRWIVGLDAEATRIGNALWRGEIIDDVDVSRVIAMFAIKADAALPFAPEVSGRPVYLLMAHDQDRLLRMKPQNLVSGLPLQMN